MKRKPALGFIFVTLALDIIGIGLIIPILPKLVQTFKGGTEADASATYGLLASLYAMMQFLCAPLLGSLSDRFGRRKVILASLFGSGLDYFLLAFAPNLGWFFVGRIIAGVTGANITAAVAYIADVSPPEKRAANFGLVGGAFGLGFILGPLMGGWLGEYGLQVPFKVAGCLAILNWLYGLFVLPESLAPENRRAFSWGRSNPVGSLMALKTHAVAFSLARSLFLINLAHQTLPSTWVLYTSYRYKWTPKETGISLAIVGLCTVMVQAGLTRLVVRKLGEQKTAILGLSVASLALVGYGLATKGWMIYLILFAGSIGGVTGPAIQAMISRGTPANEQGGVQGALASLGSVAGIIGPPICTGLFGYFIGDSAPVKIPGIAFFFSSALVLLALFLAVQSFRRNNLAGISGPAASPVPGT